jgi:hypothetical protein
MSFLGWRIRVTESLCEFPVTLVRGLFGEVLVDDRTTGWQF